MKQSTANQSAEKRVDGAKQRVNGGAIKNGRAISLLSNEPDLSSVTLQTKGDSYCTVDRFIIRVEGRGAHAARPHEGIDAIAIASQIVTALQTETGPAGSVVVCVTRFRAGNSWNVLPQTAELEGTVRTDSTLYREQIPQKFTRLIGGIAAGYGARAELEWH